MNKFYAFSGLDGAGKSTQINALNKYFEQQKFNVKVIWSRGGYTPVFQFVKDLARKLYSKTLPKPGKTVARTKTFSNPLVRKIWLTIAIFDLILLYVFYFRWLNWQGKVIIADRYAEDTIIDFNLNFPEEKVEQWLIWRLLLKSMPTPQKHFMLLIPVHESMRRSILKNEPFPDSQETLQARLRRYSNVIKNDSRFIKLDCTKPVEKVGEEIMKQISAL